MKNTIFEYITQILLASLGLMVATGCKSNTHQVTPSQKESKLAEMKRFPIQFDTYHDGVGTTKIAFNDAQEEPFSSLVFIPSSDPQANGQIYFGTDWKSSKENPLSIDDSRKALDLLEDALRKYYGNVEFNRIDSNRTNICSMSQDQMTKYMMNPQLNDELTAAFTLNLINEYRSYSKIDRK